MVKLVWACLKRLPLLFMRDQPSLPEMIKLFATALTFTATIGLAQAQPLPAPPTEVYTAPVTNACDDQSLQIYFSEGESALNASSQALLEEVQARLEGEAMLSARIRSPLPLSSSTDS